MTTTWTGDPDLATTAGTLLGRAHTVAAMTTVTPEGSATASIGAADDADFEIGSVSKALTGMLYREAIGLGRVTPSTTLGSLLPLADHGAVERVTLESLATHRSGLPRLPPAMKVWRRTWRLYTKGENPYGDTLAELLEQVRGITVGPPRAVYSNLGFQLLGHAVAAASGVRYGELLQSSFGDAFYAPATADELRPGALIGASRRGPARAPWTGEGIAPAGGIRASIGTMQGLLQRILDGTAPGMSALDPDTEFSNGVRIGAGWITLGRGAQSITWHNGGTGGFRSWIGVDRAAEVGAVVLTARDASVDRAGFRLVQKLSGR